MSEVLRKYPLEELPRRREDYLRKIVVPRLRLHFTARPTLNSVLLMVAQYWNDEAEDAVHDYLVASVLPEPELRSLAEYEAERDRLRGSSDGSYEALRDLKNDPEGVFDFDSFFLPDWEVNLEAIPLFAAYCKEGCHQDMDYLQAYSPCALFRRKGEQITIEVLEKQLRPWLDGVMPSWEQEE